MALQIPMFAQDQSFPASFLRLMLRSLTPGGVCNNGDMTVTPGSGLQVNISSGSAYVYQNAQTEGVFYNGVYFVFNDAIASPYNTISAPITNPRIDRVVARVYDITEQGLGGTSFSRFEWVTGTETAGATLANQNGAPGAPSNCLSLAFVLQTVGEASIASNNIMLLNQPIDSGWITIPLSTNITAVTGVTPSYRLIGTEVRLKGILTNNTGGTVTNGTVATIPSGVRPLFQTLNFFSSTAGSYNITTAGLIQPVSLANTASLQLDPARWSL